MQGYTNFPENITTLAELESLSTVLEALGLGTLDNMLLGLRFLIGAIPGAILLLGTIIFWIFYPLTPKKVLENKLKMKELNI